MAVLPTRAETPKGTLAVATCLVSSRQPCTYFRREQVHEYRGEKQPFGAPPKDFSLEAKWKCLARHCLPCLACCSSITSPQENTLFTSSRTTCQRPDVVYTCSWPTSSRRCSNLPHICAHPCVHIYGVSEGCATSFTPLTSPFNNLCRPASTPASPLGSTSTLFG